MKAPYRPRASVSWPAAPANNVRVGDSVASPEDTDELPDEAFAVDSEFPEPAKEGGPPPEWRLPSFYDRNTKDWYWRGRPEPCPVRPLGFRQGEYFFVTAPREIRKFRSSQLHGRGGVEDLFAGAMWWPLKHFRKWDAEKEAPTGGLQGRRCITMLMGLCIAAGYFDDGRPHRGVGTWRGPDDRPVVHAGDRILDDAAGEIFDPGSELGEALYVIGAPRQAPSYLNRNRNGFDWAPAGLEACHRVAADLDEWQWSDVEARDLFLGGLWCDMLGDAPLWKPHKFVRAPAGAGKSSLLRWAKALLGGAAHPVLKTYSRAYLEDHFGHTGCAILLDEAESETEAERVRKIVDLLLLLSDDGAKGGRFQRDIDLHGTVTMVATLTEDWKATIRSRVAYLELRPLKDPLPTESLLAMIEQAAVLSPAIRARAIARWDLFVENLRRVRPRMLELGGSPRDGDQYGHLLAGLGCMTSDAPYSDDELARLERFAPYILTIADAKDGTDDPSELFNVMMGLPGELWMGGERLTIGQMIARARTEDAQEMRRKLLAYGLRFHLLAGERYDQAWLAIANKHPGLDRLFGDYLQYKGGKRTQILSGLRRGVDEAKPSEAPLRFAGVQSRALLIPPAFLPSLDEERLATGEREPRRDEGGEP